MGELNRDAIDLEWASEGEPDRMGQVLRLPTPASRASVDWLLGGERRRRPRRDASAKRGGGLPIAGLGLRLVHSRA